MGITFTFKHQILRLIAYVFRRLGKRNIWTIIVKIKHIFFIEEFKVMFKISIFHFIQTASQKSVREEAALIQLHVHVNAQRTTFTKA